MELEKNQGEDSQMTVPTVAKAKEPGGSVLSHEEGALQRQRSRWLIISIRLYA